MINLLFSYGTLRQSEVQRALFGREVLTTEDVLPGFRLDVMLITEPDVIAKSGSDKHPILRRSSAEDVAHGALLELSDAELSAADEYEVDEYVRIQVVLASGTLAWVYVAAEEATAHKSG